MARPSTSKRNSKLENFLARNLAPKSFEGIRSYESCIVRSLTENLSLKFAVITEQALLLTENPPKALSEAFLLKDVTDVTFVSTYH
ncbi:unnamed protein product, partial [Cyprideis torosa]